MDVNLTGRAPPELGYYVYIPAIIINVYSVKAVNYPSVLVSRDTE